MIIYVCSNIFILNIHIYSFLETVGKKLISLLFLASGDHPHSLVQCHLPLSSKTAVSHLSNLASALTSLSLTTARKVFSLLRIHPSSHLQCLMPHKVASLQVCGEKHFITLSITWSQLDCQHFSLKPPHFLSLLFILCLPLQTSEPAFE